MRTPTFSSRLTPFTRLTSSAITSALSGLHHGIVCGVAGLAIVGCGEPKPAEAPSTPGTAASTPSATKATATPGKGDDKASSAAKAAALESLTQDEATKGTCDPEHQAALEKLRGDIDAAMQSKAGSDGKALALKPVFNRVVALGPNAKAIEVSLQGSLTQAHVLAYSAKDISIDVLVGTMAATTMRSPFQRTVLAKPVSIELTKSGVVELQSDSREIELEKGQPMKVKMTGQGCALVVAYIKP